MLNRCPGIQRHCSSPTSSTTAKGTRFTGQVKEEVKLPGLCTVNRVPLAVVG